MLCRNFHQVTQRNSWFAVRKSLRCYSRFSTWKFSQSFSCIAYIHHHCHITRRNFQSRASFYRCQVALVFWSACSQSRTWCSGQKPPARRNNQLLWRIHHFYPFIWQGRIWSGTYCTCYQRSSGSNLESWPCIFLWTHLSSSNRVLPGFSVWYILFYIQCTRFQMAGLCSW